MLHDTLTLHKHYSENSTAILRNTTALRTLVKLPVLGQYLLCQALEVTGALKWRSSLLRSPKPVNKGAWEKKKFRRKTEADCNKIVNKYRSKADQK